MSRCQLLGSKMLSSKIPIGIYLNPSFKIQLWT